MRSLIIAKRLPGASTWSHILDSCALVEKWVARYAVAIGEEAAKSLVLVPIVSVMSKSKCLLASTLDYEMEHILMWHSFDVLSE